MQKRSTWTGERLETFVTGETMLEHLHRYAIAMEFGKGKKILDIACGEGYGTNLLATNASQVSGVDIDEETIKRATATYSADNITFKTGSILKIPAEDSSFDVVTCFETLEHLDEHDTVLTELKRVLTPNGILLISTPEKLNYSDKTGYTNPYHKKELYGDEFKKLLKHHFPHTLFYKQVPLTGSLLLNKEDDVLNRIYTGSYKNITVITEIQARFWIAIASNQELPVFNTSIFQSNTAINELLENQTLAVQNTITYRVGNFVLSPLKFIRSIFRK